jgi:hypothetical protein
MKDHNGVLMMQRVLLAGTLGMAMAQKAAAILEGKPPAAQGPQSGEGPQQGEDARDGEGAPGDEGPQDDEEGPCATGFREPQGAEGAVLRAILDAANDCLGHFDDRPAGERWCDTLFHLLDLAAFATELSGKG